MQLEPLAINILDVNYATEDKDGTMKVYKQYDGSFWREARNEIERSRFHNDTILYMILDHQKRDLESWWLNADQW